MRLALRAPTLVRRLIPALLIGSIGLLSGCGGQSGGAPSGIAGALARVKVQMTSVALTSVAGSSNLPDDVVKDPNVFIPTRNAKSVAVVLKGAGANSEDLSAFYDLSGGTLHDYKGVKVTDFQNTTDYAVRTGKRDVLVKYYDGPAADVQSHVNDPLNGPRITNAYLFTVNFDAKQLEGLQKSGTPLQLSRGGVLNDLNGVLVDNGRIQIDIAKLHPKADTITWDVTEEPLIQGTPPVVFSDSFKVSNPDDETKDALGQGFTFTSDKSSKQVRIMPFFANRQRKLTISVKVFAGGVQVSSSKATANTDPNKDANDCIVLPDVQAQVQAISSLPMQNSITSISLSNPVGRFNDKVSVSATALPLQQTIPVSFLTYSIASGADVVTHVSGDAANTFKITTDDGTKSARISATFTNGDGSVISSDMTSGIIKVSSIVGANATVKFTIPTIKPDSTNLILTAREDDVNGQDPGITYTQTLAIPTASPLLVPVLTHADRKFTLSADLFSEAPGGILLDFTDAQAGVDAKVANNNTSLTFNHNRVQSISHVMVGSADATDKNNAPVVELRKAFNIDTVVAAILPRSGSTATDHALNVSYFKFTAIDKASVTPADPNLFPATRTYLAPASVSISGNSVTVNADTDKSNVSIVLKVTYTTAAGTTVNKFVRIDLKPNKGTATGGIG